MSKYQKRKIPSYSITARYHRRIKTMNNKIIFRDKVLYYGIIPRTE